MTQLRIAKDLQLPLEAATETIAILGIRGSGKTNTSVVITEELLDAGQQVVTIDPTDVWWGLKSSKDGKKAGYPIVIFGGRHGDVPLGAGDGAKVADLIVEERIPAILSLRHFESQADQRRLVTDFARRLYHRKGEPELQTPLMVNIDEAHKFVPQRVGAAEAQMVGAIQTLVRQGRSSGIGVTLIDQRAATVNKDVLTQLELLICHRTSSPQDRKALEAWVEQHDTEDRGAVFLEQLASLAQGTAWVWSPGWLDVFKKVNVRARHTFDSSATPKPGEERVTPDKLAAIDLDRIRGQLAAAIEKAKAEDPRELQKRIAQLERELKQKPTAAPAKVETKVKEVPVLKDAQIARLEKLMDRVFAAGDQFQQYSGALEEFARELKAGLAQARNGNSDSRVPIRKPPLVPIAAQVRTPRNTTSTHMDAARKAERANRESGSGEISGVAQRILNALAELEQLGADTPERTLVAFLAGYTHLHSKGFVNAMSALSSAGYITYPDSGRAQLTPSGQGVADYPTAPRSPAEVQDRVIKLLGGKSAEILKPLIEMYPDAMERTDLAAAAGYGHLHSKGFVNALSRLSSLGFVKYVSKGGPAVAAPVLFLEGK